MDFGEDLSLDMLDGSNTTTEEFIINTDEQKGIKENEGLARDLDEYLPPDEKTNTTSEEKKTPESVAGEEGKKKETPDATTSSPKPDAQTSKLYSSLAAQLHESGVLPSLDDSNKIDSLKKLQEAVSKEIENGRSESERQYREAITKGAPQDAYIQYKQTEDQLNSITDDILDRDESKQLRFNILAQDFLNKKFDREDAIKHARRSQELGEDIEDAKKALVRLKQHNKDSYDAILQEKINTEQKNKDNIKEFINKNDEIIKGIKLTKGVKDSLFDQMTKSVGTSKDGKPLTAYGKALEEDTVRTKTITEYLFLATNGFKDFSKLTNLVESKTATDFETLLRSTNGGFLENGKVNFNNEDNQSSFLLGDDLKIDV